MTSHSGISWCSKYEGNMKEYIKIRRNTPKIWRNVWKIWRNMSKICKNMWKIRRNMNEIWRYMKKYEGICRKYEEICWYIGFGTPTSKWALGLRAFISDWSELKALGDLLHALNVRLVTSVVIKHWLANVHMRTSSRKAWPSMPECKPCKPAWSYSKMNYPYYS